MSPEFPAGMVEWQSLSIIPERGETLEQLIRRIALPEGFTLGQVMIECYRVKPEFRKDPEV